MSLALAGMALFQTLVGSRLLMWLTRAWDGGLARIVPIHLCSGILAAFIGGVGAADHAGIAVYAAAQALWFLADILIYRHRRRAVAAG